MDLKSIAILSAYVFLCIFLGAFVFWILLKKFDIKSKEKRSIYLFPILAYAMVFLFRLLEKYIEIIDWVYLVLILAMIIWLANGLYKIEIKKSILISTIWILSFLVVNLILIEALAYLISYLNPPTLYIDLK